jgi:hypothetical protein
MRDKYDIQESLLEFLLLLYIAAIIILMVVFRSPPWFHLPLESLIDISNGLSYYT